MEAKIHDGDYVPDGLGGIVRCQGEDALLERILFRLTARRGGLPPLPRLGSRLHLLAKEPAAQRLSAARQYVAEALADEPVSVMEVALSPDGQDRIRMKVVLDYEGTELTAALTV